jgi:NitT/TauT family transport system substrate-binding protein
LVHNDFCAAALGYNRISQALSASTCNAAANGKALMRPAILIYLLTALAGLAPAADKPSFTVGWSVYVGWNPYYYMAKSGILKKWADKYNVSIRVQRFDYAPSLDAFVAKNIDACAMTNMEALDMPAAAGVDTTAIITGDYSNGNDALLARKDLTIPQLGGHRILLVEKTVSQYLLERAMTINGQESQIRKLKLVNTSDSDIATAFISDTSQEAVVTWKPLVSQIAKTKGVKMLFNSSQIPGEVVDLMVVRTDVLKRPDGSGERFAKALAGAWYETTKLMTGTGPETDKVLAAIAEGSQDTLASYKEQLSTTHLFSTAHEAHAFTVSPDFQQKMNLVRQFCFTHGLLGAHTASADDVAISYPGGAVQGKHDRVRLRFESAYMHMAEEGKL